MGQLMTTLIVMIIVMGGTIMILPESIIKGGLYATGCVMILFGFIGIKIGGYKNLFRKEIIERRGFDD